MPRRPCLLTQLWYDAAPHIKHMGPCAKAGRPGTPQPGLGEFTGGPACFLKIYELYYQESRDSAAPCLSLTDAASKPSLISQFQD